MKTMARIMISIGALAAELLLAGRGSALALTQVNSPFGPTTPVQAWIGRNTTAPVQMIVWRRRSDGVCTSTMIGNGAGLLDDFKIVGTSGNDVIVVVPDTTVDFFVCNGFRVNGLVYGGHFLDVFGGAGNDQISSGSGDTWLFGEDGDDGLAFDGMGQLFGGNGNDVLIASSSIFTSEQLWGQAGNDCLEDRNGGAGVFDCGTGTDTFATFWGVPISVNCETAVSSCP